MTSGSKNVIIGKYTGNNGGLDLRTVDNQIILSDGDGTMRVRLNQDEFICPGVYAGITGNGANVHCPNFRQCPQVNFITLRYKNTVNDATHGLW